MFLEAQFGPAVTPIEKPKATASDAEKTTEGNGVKDEPSAEQDAADELIAAELSRLHLIGIPVPGLEIRVDKNVARVWLETLEVECTNAILRDRVKAVVERAVETIAPFWGSQGRDIAVTA